jgi:hypothetical protein
VTVDQNIRELYARVQALEANKSAFTSIAKLGGIALTGAVTLSEGDNITLTETGQDIEIAADTGLPYFWCQLTDEHTEAGPVWASPGGRDFRARAWRSDTGATTVSHKSPGFTGFSDSAGPLVGAMIGLTGTFLIVASVIATFPAQQEVREAGIFVNYGVGPSDPATAPGMLRMFDLTVGSPPGSTVDQTFETSFLTSGVGNTLRFSFGEDDINDSRTTTLSTAWTLDVLALQLV